MMRISKRLLELAGSPLPLLTVAFVISERAGFWDYIRGLDQVDRVASAV
jgi:hypothetical protein